MAGKDFKSIENAFSRREKPADDFLRQRAFVFYAVLLSQGIKAQRIMGTMFYKAIPTHSPQTSFLCRLMPVAAPAYHWK